MKLIHKQTGNVVREGDKVKDFRGEEGIVLGWTKPHSPASTGRIIVEQLSGGEHHCYPEVYFCEWIDREDRLEKPQPTPVGGFSPSQASVHSSDRTKLFEALSELVKAAKKIHKQLSGYGGFNAELDAALETDEETLKEIVE